MFLQPPEVVIPESLVVRDPVPHGGEPLRDESIVTLPAMPLFGNQAGIEQHAQVLGNRGTGHLKMTGERMNGALGQSQEIEHLAPRRMTDRPKDRLFVIGSFHHAANIRKKYLTSQAGGDFFTRSRRYDKWTNGAAYRPLLFE